MTLDLFRMKRVHTHWSAQYAVTILPHVSMRSLRKYTDSLGKHTELLDGILKISVRTYCLVAAFTVRWLRGSIAVFTETTRTKNKPATPHRIYRTVVPSTVFRTSMAPCTVTLQECWWSITCQRPLARSFCDSSDEMIAIKAIAELDNQRKESRRLLHFSEILNLLYSVLVWLAIWSVSLFYCVSF